ncbi:FMN-binding protein [Natranaerobius thermophilus]|uniref:FMN-binding domain protein n=1 Tax=Natranaerobius thermophilus (strain ATCC BAA-1301 / DSM 18059 / JW/NM-WN-LF) TaxID=457570 RepID=B2A2D1_NATTJ|nr:FMN-binding protein [Natranaerobius thermophilus]ACB86237.1 FMN-binding domain protein [Natranaerobius thermophilus JW/NM-WN-LF]
MKKLAILTVLVMLFSFSWTMASEDINVENIPDGDYRGTGSGFNDDITVDVVVSDGQITSVEVVEHDDTPDYFEDAEEVLDRIVEAQSTQVDVVSGATASSEGILEAVKNALAGEEVEEQPEEDAQPEEDEAEEEVVEEEPAPSEPTPDVELTISGKTTETVTGLIEEGNSLMPVNTVEKVTEGSVEWDAQEQKVVITYENRPTLELEADSDQLYVDGEAVTMPVDVKNIDGTNYTPVRAVFEELKYYVTWEAGEINLYDTLEPVAEEPEVPEEAEEPEVSEEPEAEPLDVEDGTYRAASEEGRGFTTAEVTFEDGYIVDIDLVEHDDMGLRKELDYWYDVDNWAEVRDNYPEEYDSLQAMLDDLAEDMKATNSADVDIITGATGTAEKAIEAVDRAIDIAKGETGPFDGTFMGVSDIGARSWGIAIVTVEDGEIKEVELEEAGRDDAYTPIEEAELKDDEYPWDEFHEAKEVMPERFAEADSTDVDGVTEATGSVESWKQAVDRALANAGVYDREIGYSEANENGFVKADIVKDGDEIIDISLTEYDNKGLRKDRDYEYDVENWADIRDNYPEEYDSLQAMLDEMIERIKAADDLDEVDTISGATGTSEKAIDAVDKALSEGPYDGTFMGMSPVSARGGWNLAWVEIIGDDIQDVTLEEVQKDDGEYSIKDEDYDWEEFHEAKEIMPEWFEEKDSAEVDTYTEATGSAERWMDAVQDALRKSGRY